MSCVYLPRRRSIEGVESARKTIKNFDERKARDAYRRRYGDGQGQRRGDPLGLFR